MGPREILTSMEPCFLYPRAFGAQRVRDRSDEEHTKDLRGRQKLFSTPRWPPSGRRWGSFSLVSP
jgi:hypothetical protein